MWLQTKFFPSYKVADYIASSTKILYKTRVCVLEQVLLYPELYAWMEWTSTRIELGTSKRVGCLGLSHIHVGASHIALFFCIVWQWNHICIVILLKK